MAAVSLDRPGSNGGSGSLHQVLRASCLAKISQQLFETRAKCKKTQLDVA